MWVRQQFADVRAVLHYVGLFVIGIGLAMLLPLVTALVFAEWDVALDYVFGIGVALVLGAALRLSQTGEVKLTRAHALTLTALGWLVASFVAAIPLSLSGHYLTYLDAFFDSVSGLTTSGLTVVTDLDHMSNGHNMWRHLTHLIGGQGIVVAALSLAIGLRSGALGLYNAEGREERILPNVVYTTRFIWFVTGIYVLIGTVALFGVNLWLGMAPDRGVLHAFWISIAAYDTGGFAPQSQNAMYYHSAFFELVSVFLMLAGALNFNLHAQVWRGDRSEMWRNIETRVLAANMLVLAALTSIGLAATKYFAGPIVAVRQGAFHVLSAHSGTGHQTIYPNQWLDGMGGTAFAAIVLAMAAGGAVSSTAGGIKAFRLGIIYKGIVHQVKRALAPQSAAVATRYHHLGDRILTSEMVDAAAIIFILYAVSYITGGLIGAAYGYGAGEAVFESVSAAANVGLTTGITSATMPTGLKLLYIFQMWIGRLEFVAVLTLFAQAILFALPRRGRK